MLHRADPDPRPRTGPFGLDDHIDQLGVQRVQMASDHRQPLLQIKICIGHRDHAHILITGCHNELAAVAVVATHDSEPVPPDAFPQSTLSEVRTRPTELSDDEVAAAVCDHWELHVTAATYRPVGFGSHHWAVEGGDGPTWFVTVDDLAARRWSRTEPLHVTFNRLAAALGAACQLADHGLTFVVAPERSSSGNVLVRLDERFAIAVHRHVEGTAHDYGDVTALADRLDLVALVAQVHGASVRGAQREDLVLAMHDELLAALADLGRSWHGGPFAEQTRHVLREGEERIAAALDEHRRLAALTLERPDRFVLTHGEPHPGNTMTTAAGLVLVDWDTALVAPPERDLWMLAGGPGDRTVLDAYTRRTGVAVEDVALRTYRLHWDLTDVALYTDLLRHPHEDTEDVRESFANLRALVAAT